MSGVMLIAVSVLVLFGTPPVMQELRTDESSKAVSETAADPLPSEPVLLERILAVINGEVIALSDLETAVKLRAPDPGQDYGEIETETLDRLIDETLVLQEISRISAPAVDEDEILREMDAVRSRFSSELEFQSALRDLALSEENFRLLVYRSLIVSTYLDQRFRPFIRIFPEEVEAYYDEIFVADMKGRGIEAPPLDEVRGSIRRVLEEERLNLKISEWLSELRNQSEVVLYPLPHEEAGP